MFHLQPKSRFDAIASMSVLFVLNNQNISSPLNDNCVLLCNNILPMVNSVRALQSFHLRYGRSQLSISQSTVYLHAVLDGEGHSQQWSLLLHLNIRYRLIQSSTVTRTTIYLRNLFGSRLIHFLVCCTSLKIDNWLKYVFVFTRLSII